MEDFSNTLQEEKIKNANTINECLARDFME
jgi:hypothetical protein